LESVSFLASKTTSMKHVNLRNGLRFADRFHRKSL
jgi:hypothetical protein